jgi:hypothetical protein
MNAVTYTIGTKFESYNPYEIIALKRLECLSYIHLAWASRLCFEKITHRRYTVPTTVRAQKSEQVGTEACWYNSHFSIPLTRYWKVVPL